MKRLITVLIALVLLAACGVGAGPELGDFPTITKQETDPPFTLTAPSSRSPAAFTFTSSDAAVATVSGAQVTIHGRGETTITAAQEGIGSYGPTSKSTTLKVIAQCSAGQTPVNGACATVPTCVPPATLVNNECVTPAPSTITAATVTNGSLTWMSAGRTDTWTNARAFCRDSTINKLTGWRLPATDELSALYTSGVLAGQGWTLGSTWSLTMSSTAQVDRHLTFNLQTGEMVEQADTARAYVSCVR
jgi:hypothetical protein